MLEKIRSLSLEQKISQLFFIGLPGTELDSATKTFLAKMPVGGICLFTRNIREAQTTRKLLDDLTDSLPINPILSIDQEGGLVDRLRRILTPMPSAGKLENPENTAELAEITAKVLRILGFNTNFAPVVDIPTKESLSSQNGLQSRFLGKNLDSVNSLSKTYLETLQRNLVLGSLKHFPGLGASIVDSHEELPVVNLTHQELLEKDLVPYRNLLEIVHCVMIAHAAFPNLDLQETDQNGKLLPSSLSFNIVTKLLRQEIGFEGLVVTDDLEMGAILKNYGIGEACKMAFLAGVDMFLICNSLEAVQEGFRFVYSAVEKGEITQARLDESLLRIANFKKKLHPPSIFDINRLEELSLKIEQLNKKLN